MSLWNSIDLRSGFGHLARMRFPRLALFGPTARAAAERTAIPTVGEPVRVQVSSTSDLGVYFARVRSVGSLKIVLDMMDASENDADAPGSAGGISVAGGADV